MRKNIQFAENIGEKLRQLSKLSLEKNLNPQLEYLVKKFGGKFLQEENFAGLTIINDEKFSISFNKFTSPLRDNFYIAKALGDFLLFSNEKKEKRYGSFRIDDTTFISNSFAYGFLTPKKEFLKKAKEFNNNTTLLATYFQIPTDFIENRLKYLNIISQKDNLNNKLTQQNKNTK